MSFFANSRNTHLNKLKKVTDLQLLCFRETFNNIDLFLSKEASIPFTCHDKELLNVLFNRFFSDDLVYSANVVEPLEKKKRDFKTKCGSCIVNINEKFYVKSSDGKKLYSLGLKSAAFKPYKTTKNTRSLTKVTYSLNF